MRLAFTEREGTGIWIFRMDPFRGFIVIIVDKDLGDSLSHEKTRESAIRKPHRKRLIKEN